MKLIHIISFAVLLSCSHDKKHDAEHEHGESHEELRLNDGKKWIANPETIEGIDWMKSAIGQFETGSIQHDSLLHSLEMNFKMIFDKCTMTGTAHDQLHLYMIPLREKIKEIKAISATDSSDKMAELKTYLNLFYDFFEKENVQ